MWPFPDIQGEIGKAVTNAPQQFLAGIVQAVAFVPNQLKGVALFGEDIWNGYTPEQKATIEKAIAMLIISAAEAYVGSQK